MNIDSLLDDLENETFEQYENVDTDKALEITSRIENQLPVENPFSNETDTKLAPTTVPSTEPITEPAKEFTTESAEEPISESATPEPVSTCDLISFDDDENQDFQFSLQSPKTRPFTENICLLTDELDLPSQQFENAEVAFDNQEFEKQEFEKQESENEIKNLETDETIETTIEKSVDAEFFENAEIFENIPERNSTASNLDLLPESSTESISNNNSNDAPHENHTQTVITPPVEEALDLLPLEQTIGLLKPEWVDDSTSQECMKCVQPFTMFRRRHHCRCCGLLFCRSCCHQEFLLLYLSKADRVCVICFDELSAQKDKNEAIAKENERRLQNSVQNPVQITAGNSVNSTMNNPTEHSTENNNKNTNNTDNTSSERSTSVIEQITPPNPVSILTKIKKPSTPQRQTVTFGDGIVAKKPHYSGPIDQLKPPILKRERIKLLNRNPQLTKQICMPHPIFMTTGNAKTELTDQTDVALTLAADTLEQLNTTVYFELTSNFHIRVRKKIEKSESGHDNWTYWELVTIGISRLLFGQDLIVRLQVQDHEDLPNPQVFKWFYLIWIHVKNSKPLDVFSFEEMKFDISNSHVDSWRTKQQNVDRETSSNSESLASSIASQNKNSDHNKTTKPVKNSPIYAACIWVPEIFEDKRHLSANFIRHKQFQTILAAQQIYNHKRTQVVFHWLQQMKSRSNLTFLLNPDILTHSDQTDVIQVPAKFIERDFISNDGSATPLAAPIILNDKSSVNYSENILHIELSCSKTKHQIFGSRGNVCFYFPYDKISVFLNSTTDVDYFKISPEFIKTDEDQENQEDTHLKGYRVLINPNFYDHIIAEIDDNKDVLLDGGTNSENQTTSVLDIKFDDRLGNNMIPMKLEARGLVEKTPRKVNRKSIDVRMFVNAAELDESIKLKANQEHQALFKFTQELENLVKSNLENCTLSFKGCRFDIDFNNTLCEDFYVTVMFNDVDETLEGDIFGEKIQLSRQTFITEMNDTIRLFIDEHEFKHLWQPVVYSKISCVILVPDSQNWSL